MTAVTAIEARKKGLSNLFFFTAHKIVPPVMEALVNDPDLNLDGFLLPGNVCAIIGTEPFQFLSKNFMIRWSSDWF